ncbi:hypothetical protein ACIBSW_37435 [Actinoplanes sp. NPDC049668]|uniref:hypothetical protein n=1 Tax=unclassified Actinoplanes TaxID=2626549 RepID=UPI0033BED832
MIFPREITYAAAVSQHRRVYRQRDWQGFAGIGLALAPIPVVTWLTWPESTALFSLMFAAAAVAIYLGGTCTSVVVTSDAVVVRNIFRSWRVSRSLLVPVDPHRDVMDTTLAVKGHPSIDISAFHTTFNHTPMREGPWWLVKALQDIGPLPDDGRRTWRLRWLNIALAVAVVATFAWNYAS